MASTSNQNPSSPTRWDVFLSFRGPDTRLQFNSHLYKSLVRTGIPTFVDDPELRAGDVISDALMGAIKNSRIYIVVLSKNYASSCWCLDELVEIHESSKSVGRLVVPIFYNIDPSVVRHQKGDFGKSFEKLEQHFDNNKMDSWRVALKQVAGISGHDASAKRSEADVIDEVVDQVLQEIKPMTLEVAKYPVGIDSRIAGITPWLSSGTEGVVKIGIYGMVGIGKTALAKAVYNQNFHRFKGCCFLASVGEVSKQQNGLQILQEQLIADVLKVKKIPIDNVDQGIAWIKQRICLPKIFIVIDDIDSQYQFDSLSGPFAPGSVIIVTTRNQDLLNTIKVEHNYQYEVKKLDGVESLELFTRHAFGDDEPSEIFAGFFGDILNHAGGLPLALMFYGSNLLNKPVAGWRNFLRNLPQNPDARVQRKLIGSFEALDLEDHKLKDIFLDIACFFIGEDKEDVLKILETCYTSADYKMDLLKMRCLMTINSENKLTMHELFQAMGRKIARNNNDRPELHSRLWVSRDICNVLRKNKGTEKIEGIIPDDRLYNNGFNKVRLAAAKIFRKMDRLRFLYLSDVELNGSFEEIFEDLRWLHWSDCPLQCLPSDFCPENLVILELPRSKIKSWKLTRDFKSLKILDVSCSVELTSTPDFNRVPHLETLVLSGCVNLGTVGESIGNLVKLVSLDLSNSKKLRFLPDSMSKLTALKSLNILGCDSLGGLPKGLEKIESLTELRACGLTISKSPYSIGGLISELLSLLISRWRPEEGAAD